MTSAKFQAAVLRGMAASPFSGSVVVIMGSTRYTIAGCQVASGDNKAESDEYGTAHVRTLKAHLPKLINGSASLPRALDAAKDAIEYQGRKYNLTSIQGADACSPVWVIDCAAPL